ncbi:DNA-processing protein DprA [Demequina sp. NBRC 110055]|uniref:DNA-processing protein DprA n=1 Tax=Demequina sp. NBRC 110055 TaxID=1570344 RepID=UPI0009FE1EAC|nr:DNA-processing protein DprA [Demequina sp. NBRC 110055]
MNEDREALLRWSVLAEASDQAASWLVDTLGPAAAFAWAGEAQANPVAATAHLARHAPPELIDKAIAAVPRWTARLDRADPGTMLRNAKVCGAHAMVRGDHGWPRALADLGPQEPYALWVRGEADLDAAWAGGIALVGSRSASSYGEGVTADIAAGLAEGTHGAAPRAIVSGGAYGIDARAHRTALAVGGTTIAVLAGGIDQFYPAGNADLLARVAATGAVVSEMPPGHAPYRARFLSRNRLIAAAAATIVVEAARRSGALSTARHAAALYRPLGAVPGPVTASTSGGCHELLRDNIAVLVRDATDVRELAGPLLGEADRESTGDGIDFAHPHDRAAFDAVGGRGGGADEVASRAGLTVTEALTSLGRLELSGAVVQAAGTWQRVTKPRV